MKLAAGSVVAGRYRIGSLLGEGGMGQVWSATHLVTGRAVAIKRLLIHLHEERERQARARFVLEAQAASAVDHPNVVEVLDFVDREAEPPLLVMELLVGETLADKLSREHSLGLAEAVAVLLPVVSAVGTAHSRGIVHRDLKPANIFLSQREGHERRVKVLDFGIAKWLRARPETGTPRTQTGSTMGTPSYMAPEQAMGERDLDHKLDLWAIGVILYECLSGARPVEGENAAQMVMRLLNSGIIPIEKLVPDLPTELGSIIGRMLQRDRGRRPEDLRGLFQLLSSLTDVRAPTFGPPVLGAPSEQPATWNADGLATPDVAWGPDPQRRPGPSVQSSPTTALSALPRVPAASRAIIVTLFACLGLVAFLAIWRELRPSQAEDAPPPRQTHAGLAASTHAARLAPEPTPTTNVAPPPPRSTTTPQRTSERTRAPRKPTVLPPEPAAPVPATASSGLPRGASCERSRQCTSMLCVAFACE